jgi:phosphohistidine phosphatase
MANKKTLFIVRHGKSTWDYEAVSDIDRPLKERGIKDAYEIAGRIKNKRQIPQRILSSPAIRALHTAIIFSRVLEVREEEIIISEGLFHADPAEIINLVGNSPGHIDSLMIFGHNPGFTSLSNILSNLSLDNVPTSGLVKLVFETDSWKKIGRKNLVEESFDFPSNE